MRPRLQAAGAILLAAAWGFRDGFFVKPRPDLFWLTGTTGVLLLIAGSGVAGKNDLRRRISEGAAAALAIGAAHLAMQAVLPVILSHLHRIPGGAEVAAASLAILGLDSGVDHEGNLLLHTMTGARPFALTWELAALPALLRLAVSAALIGGLAMLPRGLLLIASLGAARALLLIAMVAGGARISLCYEPAITLLALLPLALFLPAKGAGLPAPAPYSAPQRARARIGVACLAVAGACFGAWAAHRDPGIKKQGRVVIDESRSNWEWIDQPFDHARYGQRSLYNYSLWRSWIEQYYDTRVLDEPPTERDLALADVLVIKTPTAPYDAGTIGRIERFVRLGGGLYLIGDHTNLYGMSTVLNRIAAPYGIAFEFDDTFPLDHEDYDIFTPQEVASHPALRGIERYPFETSCTLRVPWSSDHLMIGRRLGAEMVDYGHVNFFGNIRLDASERFGLFTQAAAVPHGSGRVAAFADSTNFSNFSFLWPGRRQLTLNIIDWLNRKQSGAFSGAVAACVILAGLAAAALGGLLLSGRSPWTRAGALWAAVGCFAFAAQAASLRTARLFETPAPLRPASTIAFDTSMGRLRIEPASPILSRRGGSAWTGFNALYINTARSGLWPELTGDLVRSFEEHEAVVLVNPARPPAPEERVALGEFLARGGRLLVCDSIFNSRSTAHHLLKPLGFSADLTLLPLSDSGEGAVAPALAATAAAGLARRVTRGGGVAVWRRAGRGKVVLLIDSALFSDRGFGGVYTTPNEKQRKTYDGLREAIQILMEPQPEEEEDDPGRGGEQDSGI